VQGAALGDEPLELIDRDGLRSPRHLERLDERKQAAGERRRSDANRI
jgi:hypothetical protein